MVGVMVGKGKLKLKTINGQKIEGVGNIEVSTEQVQADWTQTDTSEPDYIKNKPSLATVATSGSYDDLSDKPTIPAAQVQSDWNQSNSSAVDFIKNKPTIPAAQVNADWNASSGVAQILNKPTIPAAQVQSDWDQTDTTAVDFIKNKPTDLGGIDYTEVETKAEMEELTASQGDIVKVTDDGNNSGLYIYDEYDTPISIEKIVCSQNTTFFLTSDGKLYGMGQNNYGQQGDGTTSNVTTPKQIGSTLGTVTDISCSQNTTFFLTSDGKLYGMGQNNYGQQGNGQSSSSAKVTTPTQVGSTLGTITDVICSDYTTFFLTSNGELYGTGRNQYGQQGDGTTSNVTTPTRIGTTLGTISKVICSTDTTFFLTSDGKLYGMGYNYFNQQGSGSQTDVLIPTQIGSTLGTISKVVCSTHTTFFLTSDGKLYGMGYNSNGQQGDGTTSNVTTPKQIGSTLGTVTDVVCSSATTLFLTSDGKLYGMGANSFGQLGGFSYNITTPTQIGSTLGTITDVVCEQSDTFFLTSDSKLYGIGQNNFGQQGNNNTSTNVTTPTQIGSTLGTIINVVCSYCTTFFIMSDGKLYGMGYNYYGQQGNSDTSTNVLTPTQIASDIAPTTETVTGFVLMLNTSPSVPLKDNNGTSWWDLFYTKELTYGLNMYFEFGMTSVYNPVCFKGRFLQSTRSANGGKLQISVYPAPQGSAQYSESDFKLAVDKEGRTHIFMNVKDNGAGLFITKMNCFVWSTIKEPNDYFVFPDNQQSSGEPVVGDTYDYVIDATSLGDYSIAPKARGLIYLEPTVVTTGVLWAATTPDITSYFDGLMVVVKCPENTATGLTLQINSLSAPTIVFNVVSGISTRYSANSIIILTYKTIDGTPYWSIMDYDANTNTIVRQYQVTDNVEYSILARYNTTDKAGTYDASYARYCTGVKLNPSTGKITATEFVGPATKLGTATKGSATQPIYLNAGVPTAGTALKTGAYKNITISTANPSGGSNGDIWFQYEA